MPRPKPIAIHLSEEDLANVDALVARVGPANRHAMALAALKEGLSRFVEDPSRAVPRLWQRPGTRLRVLPPEPVQPATSPEPAAE